MSKRPSCQVYHNVKERGGGGGKYFSNKHKVITWSDCNLSNVVTSAIFEQNKLKKKHSLIIASFTSFRKTHLMAIDKSYYIRTWQSWDLRP